MLEESKSELDFFFNENKLENPDNQSVAHNLKEPASPSRFFNNHGKESLTNQDVNLKMQDVPVYLDNNEQYTLYPNKYKKDYHIESLFQVAMEQNLKEVLNHQNFDNTFGFFVLGVILIIVSKFLIRQTNKKTKRLNKITE